MKIFYRDQFFDSNAFSPHQNTFETNEVHQGTKIVTYLDSTNVSDVVEEYQPPDDRRRREEGNNGYDRVDNPGDEVIEPTMAALMKEITEFRAEVNGKFDTLKKDIKTLKKDVEGLKVWTWICEWLQFHSSFWNSIWASICERWIDSPFLSTATSPEADSSESRLLTDANGVEMCSVV